MPETTINIIDALKGQQAQLKRLLAQKMWISNAPKAALAEMDAQVAQIPIRRRCSRSPVWYSTQRLGRIQSMPAFDAKTFETAIKDAVG